MQAILTKYHGPTDTKGSRISAEAQAGRISVPYNHALSIDGNHEAAAREYASRKGWLMRWEIRSGTLPDGSQAHVLCDPEPMQKAKACVVELARCLEETHEEDHKMLSGSHDDEAPAPGRWPDGCTYCAALARADEVLA